MWCMMLLMVCFFYRWKPLTTRQSKIWSGNSFWTTMQVPGIQKTWWTALALECALCTGHVEVCPSSSGDFVYCCSVYFTYYSNSSFFFKCIILLFSVCVGVWEKLKRPYCCATVLWSSQFDRLWVEKHWLKANIFSALSSRIEQRYHPVVL